MVFLTVQMGFYLGLLFGGGVCFLICSFFYYFKSEVWDLNLSKYKTYLSAIF